MGIRSKKYSTTQSGTEYSTKVNSTSEPVREVYKVIFEENHNPQLGDEHVKSVKTPDTENQDQAKQEPKSENGDTKMVQGENNVNDGADEQMLGSDDIEKLANKRDEVKFIKGDHQNGDAKIDMGDITGKAFTGMTKEELMKYANDPFWVRLRWVFFIGFWAIWVAMLVGAILIIVESPKCAAPEPLPWFKRGLLAKYDSIDVATDLNDGSVEGGVVADVAAARKVRAAGVIYELPPELTYSVHDPTVEQKIKTIVDSYKDAEINVILDITPNYVTKDSQMMRDALADETKRSPFIWSEKPVVPNNWLSIVNGSAWTEIQPGNYVLSQFGDGLFDLHMNDTIVKQQLTDALKHLLALGVKGFRLHNTKFYLLSKNIQDESPAPDANGKIHTEYGFWTHTQTTFQDGLGDVLYEYLVVVKNASADAFLSVTEDVVRPEVYQTSTGGTGVDMPIYGRVVSFLSSNDPQSTQLASELNKTIQSVDKFSWLQWNLADVAENSPVDPSAFDLFMSLLPGVIVVPMKSNSFRNVSENTYKHIEQLRLSPSYMHGDFEILNATGELLAYTRIKSGNPGYFVALNPTSDTQLSKNFSSFGLPDKMTVDAISDNFNITGVTLRSKTKQASDGAST